MSTYFRSLNVPNLSPLRAFTAAVPSAQNAFPHISSTFPVDPHMTVFFLFRPQLEGHLLIHLTICLSPDSMPGTGPAPAWSGTSRLLIHTGKNSRLSHSEKESKFFSGREKQLGCGLLETGSGVGLQVSQAVAAKEVRVRVQGDAGELASELCTGSVCSWDFMFPRLGPF